jgi:hypothetical protein
MASVCWGDMTHSFLPWPGHGNSLALLELKRTRLI